MDGTECSSSQSVNDKVKLISEKTKIPVFLWDERLSTVGAFNLSSQIDINVSKRVKNIDKNAAAFILQGVLDFFDLSTNADVASLDDIFLFLIFETNSDKLRSIIFDIIQLLSEQQKNLCFHQENF